MKKSKKHLLIIFVFLAFFISIGVWQWNNFAALIAFSEYSKADLKEKLNQESVAISEAMNKIPGNVTDLSEEDKKKLLNGDITKEQAIEMIIQKSEPETENSASEVTEVEQPDVSKAETAVPNDDNIRINELIAELYVLRTTYSSNIDALIKKASEEYSKLTDAEKTESSKRKIYVKYLSQASGMEKTCDRQVNAIISDLKALLIKTNGDVSLINDIKDYYYSEKSLKKAYLISLYR